MTDAAPKARNVTRASRPARVPWVGIYRLTMFGKLRRLVVDQNAGHLWHALHDIRIQTAGRREQAKTTAPCPVATDLVFHLIEKFLAQVESRGFTDCASHELAHSVMPEAAPSDRVQGSLSGSGPGFEELLLISRQHLPRSGDPFLL